MNSGPGGSSVANPRNRTGNARVTRLPYVPAGTAAVITVVDGADDSTLVPAPLFACAVFPFEVQPAAPVRDNSATVAKHFPAIARPPRPKLASSLLSVRYQCTHFVRLSASRPLLYSVRISTVIFGPTARPRWALSKRC